LELPHTAGVLKIKAVCGFSYKLQRSGLKQVLQSYSSGELWLAEVPAPALGPRQVLVANRASLISSGTERQLMELAGRSLLGKARARPDQVRRVLQKIKTEGFFATLRQVRAKLDTPAPLGYSCSGEVLEVGAEISASIRVGDRVACGGAGYASHSEVVAVPFNLVTPLPGELDFEQGAFAALGAIAMQGVRQAQPELGDFVVVMGLGLIGLLTVQLLKASGVRVLGVDIRPERCEKALSLGAEQSAYDNPVPAVLNWTNGHGADKIIITASTPSSEAVNQAAEMARLRARVVVVGFVGMNLIHQVFYKKEIELRMALSYGPGRYDPLYEEYGYDYPYAYVRWTEKRNMAGFLDLAAKGALNLKALVSHRYPIERALEAYKLLKSRELYYGLILQYGAGREPSRRLEFPQHLTSKEAAVRLSVIGAGNFAKGVLLPLLSQIGGCEFRGICTAGGLNCSSLGEKYKFAFATTDERQIFADKLTNTLIIATRHNSHMRLLLQGLKAGFHVFVEKPLALTEAEIGELESFLSASQLSTQFLVGYNRRFSPFSAELKKHFAGLGPLVINYRVNAGALPEDHWLLGEEGGGRILGEVCHFVDYALFLTGAEPVAVYAAEAGSAKQGEQAYAISLSLGDGSLAAITYFGLGDPALPKEYLEVHGGGRSAVLEDWRTLTTYAQGKPRVRSSRRQLKGYQEEMHSFITRVRDGGRWLISLDELLSGARATMAILHSLKQGTPVRL